MKKKGFLSLLVGQFVTVAVVYAIKNPKEAKDFASKAFSKASKLLDRLNGYIAPVIEKAEDVIDSVKPAVEEEVEKVSHKKKHNS